MASNPFKNITTGMAMAALPIVSVPIQDVQLFDYALAHKSVHSSYGLTANADDTYILDKDPYTSDQQRSRDQYEINDNDWNEVTFEQLLGSSLLAQVCNLSILKPITNPDITRFITFISLTPIYIIFVQKHIL